MAYRIALPPSLIGVHNIFHVSQLKKCLAKEDAMIAMHQPEIQPNLTLLEKPKKILDQKDKILRNKVVKLVKVLWNNQTEEATWELKDGMK